MLKRQDIKLNSSGISSSGKMSCLTLLFLTFLLINPTTTSASALEVEDVVDHDNQVSTQADFFHTVIRLRQLNANHLRRCFGED